MILAGLLGHYDENICQPQTVSVPRTSFLRAKLKENPELRKAHNVKDIDIYPYLFLKLQYGGYCVV